MISMTNVRSIAALALAASMLLPQYSCSEYVDMNGKALTFTPEKADSGKTYRVVDVDHYVPNEVERDQPATFILPVIFLWPLAFALLVILRPRAAVARAIRWVEPALLAFGLYVVFDFVMGTRRYGNYLALAAAGSLLAISLWEWIERFRRWRADRTVPAAA